MGSKGGYKGPSAAELSRIARQEADYELEKLKSQQEFERGKINQQQSFDREVQAQKMSQLKTQSDLQKSQFDQTLAKQVSDEQNKLLEEKNQVELQAKQEKERATNQSELNSKELAGSLARRKTYLESIAYLDDDDLNDEANDDLSTKRARVSKAT